MTQNVHINPLPGPLAAEVECSDVRFLGKHERELLRQAWLDHLVLVFHDQSLTDPELVAFSRIFGEPEVAAVAPKDGIYQEVAVVSNVYEGEKPIGVLGAGELLWHSDHSFNERPLSASILYALEVPDQGGDTWFNNMYLALDTLSPSLQRKVQGRTIKNDGTYNSAGERRTNTVIDDLRTYQGPSHPIVRTHSDTGFNTLYLGRRPNAYINGLSVDESEALLDELWSHASQQRLAWRHKWSVGDVLVWDNRCTMHRRDAFDPGSRRVMHRAQCAGERPTYRASASWERHPRAYRSNESANLA